MRTPLPKITHGRPLTSADLGAGVRAHSVAHATRSEVAEHSHENASLSLVLTGAFRERRPEAVRDCAVLDVLFKPPGLPHASATGASPTRTITLALEPEVLTPELARLDRAVQISGGPVVAGLLEIGAALTERPEGPTAGAITESLLAELTRHVRETDHASDDVLDHPLARSARLLGNRASVRRAAESARMHPVAFARAFRRRFGCAPSVYRRRRLVARAAAAVPRSVGQLASVAQGAGFADQAHLTRAFRAETGLTPGAYRSLVASLFPCS